MTPLSARGRKDRLLRVFDRTGGSGRWTRSFDSLPEVAQRHIRAEITAIEREEFILASYRDELHWVLVTSERLIARGPAVDAHLSWAEIADATIDPSELQAALSGSPEGKLNLRRLHIKRTDGGVFDLEVEPGPSFVGLWNVLKTMAALGSPQTPG